MSSPFRPDVESLLKRPRIEKPREEFFIPGPDEEAPLALPDDDLSPDGVLALLNDEAARLQELINLLEETAEPFVVALDPEERNDALLDPEGKGEISIQDYIGDVRDGDPSRRRRRKRFERGLLDQGCGMPIAWPILALPDLFGMRDAILGAVTVMEGTLLDQARVAQQEAWRRRAEASQVAGVHREQVEQSRVYRSQFARAVATMYQDLKGPLLACLMTHGAEGKIAAAGEAIGELCDLLKMIRSLLCHAMLIRMLQFLDVREALEALLKDMILQQLLNMLGILLNQFLDMLVQPVVAFLNQRVSDDCFIAAAGDVVSKQLLGVLGESVVSIHHQFTDLLADLYRRNQQHSQARLEGLKKLGERNTIGRWILHLDQAIELCELVRHSSASADLQMIYSFLERKLEPAASKLLTKMEAHPEYGPQLNEPQLIRVPDLGPTPSGPRATPPGAA